VMDGAVYDGCSDGTLFRRGCTCMMGCIYQGTCMMHSAVYDASSYGTLFARGCTCMMDGACSDTNIFSRGLYDGWCKFRWEFNCTVYVLIRIYLVGACMMGGVSSDGSLIVRCMF
jgi:hypothetical protein